LVDEIKLLQVTNLVFLYSLLITPIVDYRINHSINAFIEKKSRASHWQACALKTSWLALVLEPIELYSFSSILGTIFIPFLGYFFDNFFINSNFSQLKFLFDH